MKKIGFIGCGKMATAIISGIIKSKMVENEDIIASETNEDFAKSKSESLNIQVLCDNTFVAKNCETIFLAVKPHFVKEILEQIKPYLTENQLVVSIAAGFKIEKIEKIIEKSPVIRVMPNAPLMYQEGMCAIAKGTKAKDKDAEYIYGLLSKLGKCIYVDEKNMNTVTAISGSSPAYFFKFIEEIARAGEKMGLSYEKSLLLSAQTAFGSAKMVLESGLTMNELIAIITTKGGCTEVGVNYLTEIDTKNIMQNLIEKTEKKASELG